jgi:hypothetical protein
MNIVDVLAILPYFVSTIVLGLRQAAARQYRILSIDAAVARETHRARIPSPLPLRVAKTGRNHLNEEFTPLLPTGIGERF